MVRSIQYIRIFLFGLLCLPALPLHAQLSSMVVVKSPSAAADSLEASADSICLFESAQLSVMGGYLGDGADWYWYADGCGTGPVVGTGPLISVSPTVNTTYYCRAQGDCNTTACSMLTITIKDSLLCVPTPVDLLDFRAQLYAEHQGLLTWQTAGERDVAFFALEESGDGSTYTELTRVQAAGTGTNAGNFYSYIDPVLKPGFNYYRLRIVDLNGSTAWSPVRILRYEPGRLIQSPVLYPNPTNGTLHFEFFSTAESSIKTWFINVVSQKIYEVKTSKTVRGRNVIDVDVSAVADGTYLFVYQPEGAQGNNGIRFIKETK